MPLDFNYRPLLMYIISIEAFNTWRVVGIICMFIRSVQTPPRSFVISLRLRNRTGLKVAVGWRRFCCRLMSSRYRVFLSRGGRGGRLLSLFGPSGATLPAGVKRCCQVFQQLVLLAPLSPEAPYGHADNTSAFHWGFTDIHPATSFPLYKFYCHLWYIQRIWLLCRFVRIQLC